MRTVQHSRHGSCTKNCVGVVMKSQSSAPTIPTLLIWGDRDRYLGLPLTEGLGRWVRDLHVEHLPDASHWVQNDAPGQVNRLLTGFLCTPR